MGSRLSGYDALRCHPRVSTISVYKGTPSVPVKPSGRDYGFVLFIDDCRASGHRKALVPRIISGEINNNPLMPICSREDVDGRGLAEA